MSDPTAPVLLVGTRKGVFVLAGDADPHDLAPVRAPCSSATSSSTWSSTPATARRWCWR